MNPTFLAEKKRWNRPDIEFYIKLIALTISAILIILAAAYAVVGCSKQLFKLSNDYLESKIVNDEILKLCKMEDVIKDKLIYQGTLDAMKKIYDSKQLEIQQAAILNAHTKIASKAVPYGTWVYLKDLNRAVKVSGHEGYEIKTYEGINFLLTDDNYISISQNKYDFCKRVEELYAK